MPESFTPRFGFPQWTDGDHGWGTSINEAWQSTEANLGILYDTRMQDAVDDVNVHSGTMGASANQFVRMDASSSNGIVNLPGTGTNGTVCGVTIVALSGSHTVTIHAAGGTFFYDPSSTVTNLVLSQLYETVYLKYQFGFWTVVGHYVSMAALDARFGGGASGSLTIGSAAWLIGNCNLDIIVAGTITRDSNGAATSATVAWPDGTSGTYTADTVSTAFPGAVDAFHVTYLGATTKTVTQPALTRDSTTGAVTNKPALAVT